MTGVQTCALPIWQPTLAELDSEQRTPTQSEEQCQVARHTHDLGALQSVSASGQHAKSDSARAKSALHLLADMLTKIADIAN